MSRRGRPVWLMDIVKQGLQSITRVTVQLTVKA